MAPLPPDLHRPPGCRWKISRFVLKGVVECLYAKMRDNVRLRIEYGNYLTGQPWEGGAEYGRIGQSSGEVKIPLLVFNTRSMGGHAILMENIVSIGPSARAKKSTTRECFWKHPMYGEVKMQIGRPSELQEYLGFHHIKLDATQLFLKKVILPYKR